MDHTELKKILFADDAKPYHLLSGKEIADMAAAYADDYEDPSWLSLYDIECAYAEGAHNVAIFFNQKITSGELMVVKTVHRVETQEAELGFLERCSTCEEVICPMDNFCPGCGARIIE